MAALPLRAFAIAWSSGCGNWVCATRACSMRCARCRAKSSSIRLWPVVPTRTRPECPDPKSSKVLEIGTGCGYAAAVLAQLFGTVISIERVRALHELARGNLRPLRIAQLRLAFGDGSLGVPSEAPFDVITAAAAGEEIPPAWIAQLKPGGRIVAPVGSGEQQMTIVSKDAQGRVSRRTSEPVRFVPLRGGTV